MIYLLLFMACCLLVFLENSKGTENLMKVLQPIFIFGLILFVGFRLVGPDYESYHGIYDNIRGAKKIVEPFFFYTMTFFSSRKIDFALFMCFIAAISILIKTVVIKRHSPYFFLSLIIGLPTVFLGDMGQIRSTLAAATVMLAIPYCVDREPWKFVLVLLVAVSMHLSALIFIFAYFLPSFRLHYPYLILIWIACYIMSFFMENSTIGALIDQFAKDTMLDSKAEQYIEDENMTYIGRVAYTLSGALLKLFILTLLYYSNIDNDRLKSFFINVYFIGGCLFFFFGFSEIMMNRTSCYYFFFQFISIPLVLYHTKNKVTFWVLMIMFICLSFYHYYGQIFSSYSVMYLPYRSALGNFLKF